jgi:hypothetical protein
MIPRKFAHIDRFIFRTDLIDSICKNEDDDDVPYIAISMQNHVQDIEYDDQNLCDSAFLKLIIDLVDDD